jgi:ABC-type transport system substrate-binding protein
MPQSSADFRTWTVQLRKGIHFQADPAFKGVRREVVAQDFVYPLQRIADPATRSPLWGWIESQGFVGLAEARKAALDSKQPFDYDRPIAGVTAVDRYTIRFTLKEARPRFVETIASSDLLGAQAREVVEHYGDQIDAHPVGSGPFRLKQWRRSSLIVLERSPDFRDEFYDAQPAADDAEGQALLARLKGRKLPLVDEVRVSIIDEAQPFWLSFLNEQLDSTSGLNGAVPGEFVPQAMPGGRIAPNLAKRGIQAARVVASSTGLTMFNMEDPVIGGYTPDKVALRRAIFTGLRRATARSASSARGLAIPAQSPLSPGTTGYDPKFKQRELRQYSPARAKALLDLYGYVDRDGDGWRELPDGKPLVHGVYSTQADQAKPRVRRRSGRRTWTPSACARASTWASGASSSRRLAPASCRCGDWPAPRRGWTGTAPSCACTARSSAGRTSRASGWPSSTRCTTACPSCPTAPSATRCSCRARRSPRPTRPTAPPCTRFPPTCGTPGSSASGARCSGTSGGT